MRNSAAFLITSSRDPAGKVKSPTGQHLSSAALVLQRLIAKINTTPIAMPRHCHKKEAALVVRGVKGSTVMDTAQTYFWQCALKAREMVDHLKSLGIAARLKPP